MSPPYALHRRVVHGSWARWASDPVAVPSRSSARPWELGTEASLHPSSPELVGRPGGEAVATCRAARPGAAGCGGAVVLGRAHPLHHPVPVRRRRPPTTHTPLRHHHTHTACIPYMFRQACGWSMLSDVVFCLRTGLIRTAVGAGCFMWRHGMSASHSRGCRGPHAGGTASLLSCACHHHLPSPIFDQCRSVFLNV